MFINGKITILTKEVKTKAGSKTVLLNTYLSTKDENKKEYRTYKPVALRKTCNVSRDNFKPGFVYHVELENDDTNILSLTEYKGEVKEIIYLGNIKITGEYPVKTK